MREKITAPDPSSHFAIFFFSFLLSGSSSTTTFTFSSVSFSLLPFLSADISPKCPSLIPVPFSSTNVTLLVLLHLSSPLFSSNLLYPTSALLYSTLLFSLLLYSSLLYSTLPYFCFTVLYSSTLLFSLLLYSTLLLLYLYLPYSTVFFSSLLYFY